jgi:uncharacterized protein GlcG (DUF336 family)
MSLTLDTANTIIAESIRFARTAGLQPLVVVVLDARATVKAAGAEDNTSTGRFAIAAAKANGALAMGMGSRALGKRAKDLPSFYQSLTSIVPGGLVPIPGGVLLRNAEGAVIGAVGISGDVGDNDERAALAGIAAAGLIGDPGES